MSTHPSSIARRLCGSALMAGLMTLGLSAPSVAETFYAQPALGGALDVVDASGEPVSVVYAIPAGTKPGICPYGSYYFTDLDSDKSELALTDCATGNENYAVEVLGAS